MPRKRYPKSRFIVFFLALFVIFPEAKSSTFGEELEVVSQPPSVILRDKTTQAITSYQPSPGDYPFVCDDVTTGALLSCPYTYRLVGVDFGTDPFVTFNPPLTNVDSYGGHDHNLDSHPFYWVANASDPLSYPHDAIQVLNSGPFTRPDSLTVRGNTQNQETSLRIIMPEAAGSIWVDLIVGSPPGYVCIGVCWTSTESRSHITYLVQTEGFVQVPLQGTDYAVVRTTDFSHTDANATWALPGTITQLLTVAQKYHVATMRTLSINDMSLPKGGLFDIGSDWSPPHISHRDGKAFDVNKCDGGSVCTPCSQTDELHVIARVIDGLKPDQQVFSKNRPVGILCESGGRIHVNINN